MKTGPILLLAGAGVCLALALSDQLTSGDLYDPGSTLRTDREGGSAFFEALQKTGAQVERNYLPLDGLEVANAAILVTALSTNTVEQSEFAESMAALARRGNRVTISLDGTAKMKDWKLEVQRVPRTAASADQDVDDDSPAPWPLYFTAGAEWHVARSVDRRAVMVERGFGAGSIALVASTKPFLNLALRDDRDVPLLEWTRGNARHIIFDESHLGSRQSGTMMGLMRRLRLQGLLAALIAAALLYFWRASVPFPPVRETADSSGPRTAGSTSGEALRNLLERRIPPAALLPACVQEWARDFARRAGAEAVKEASELAGAAGARPAEQWEQIRGIVRKARTHD